MQLKNIITFWTTPPKERRFKRTYPLTSATPPSFARVHAKSRRLHKSEIKVRASEETRRPRSFSRVISATTAEWCAFRSLTGKQLSAFQHGRLISLFMQERRWRMTYYAAEENPHMSEGEKPSGTDRVNNHSQQIRSSFLWLFKVKISLRADLRFFSTETWGWRRYQLMFKSTENVDVGPHLQQSLSGWKWGQGLIDRKFLNCIMLVEIVKQTVCDWASASLHSCPQLGHQVCSFQQISRSFFLFFLFADTSTLFCALVPLIIQSCFTCDAGEGSKFLKWWILELHTKTKSHIFKFKIKIQNVQIKCTEWCQLWHHSNETRDEVCLHV